MATNFGDWKNQQNAHGKCVGDWKRSQHERAAVNKWLHMLSQTPDVNRLCACRSFLRLSSTPSRTLVWRYIMLHGYIMTDESAIFGASAELDDCLLTIVLGFLWVVM
jgi:hypothetical protein